MSIIWMIIVGLVVGAVAKLIMPGDQGGGIIVTVLLGIAGSIVAGYLGGAVGFYAPGEGAGFIGSVVGALIVLFVYGLIKKKA
ncbi:MAG: GlsB/YeaQ/YmgE family stress response membrane protein [Burkholderiaceae bacterium]